MPSSPCRSSRDPAPIHIPIATDRTDETRSVTIRSPPSSVVTVYRCIRRTLTAVRAPRRSPRRGLSTTAPARASSRGLRGDRARRNLAEISVWISSPAARRTPDRAPGSARPARSATAGGRPPTRARNPSAGRGRTRPGRSRRQGGRQDAQHVSREGGGDAAGIVVGCQDAIRRLHEVDAQEQPVAGDERRCKIGEEARPHGRGRARWCWERDHARPAARQQAQVALEVRHQGQATPGTPRRRLPRPSAAWPGDTERHEPLSVPAANIAESRRRVWRSSPSRAP